MVRPFEVLLALSFLLASEAQMNELEERSHFLSASVGENITLPCLKFSKVENVRYYWYKQSLAPTLVAAYFKYEKTKRFYGEFNSSKRFTWGHEENHLQINHVQVSDSGVYLCVSCVFYQIQELESFTVIVKSLNPGAEVLQSPHEDTEEGGAVILKCSVHTGSCGGQHTVHWFKQSEESAPGVLYSHGGGNSDQCGRNTDSPTNSCVYSLPIHNVSSEQTGSYYCAVAACGQVLFGNGTRVKIKGRYITYVLSGALVFSSVLVVILVYSLCRMKKKYNMLSTEFKCQHGSSAVSDGAYQDQEDSLNYAALNFHPVSRRQRITEQTDCVYSSVQ